MMQSKLGDTAPGDLLGDMAALFLALFGVALAWDGGMGLISVKMGDRWGHGERVEREISRKKRQ